MQEIESRSLGWKDPLEKEMATHSKILAWEIWTEGTWQASVHGVAKESDMTQRLNNNMYLLYIFHYYYMCYYYMYLLYVLYDQ